MKKLILIRGVVNADKDLITSAMLVETMRTDLPAAAWYRPENATTSPSIDATLDAIASELAADGIQCIYINSEFTTIEDIVPYLKLAIIHGCEVQLLDFITENSISTRSKYCSNYKVLRHLAALRNKYLIFLAGKEKIEALMTTPTGNLACVNSADVKMLQDMAIEEQLRPAPSTGPYIVTIKQSPEQAASVSYRRETSRPLDHSLGSTSPVITAIEAATKGDDINLHQVVQTIITELDAPLDDLSLSYKEEVKAMQDAALGKVEQAPDGTMLPERP